MIYVWFVLAWTVLGMVALTRKPGTVRGQKALTVALVAWCLISLSVLALFGKVEAQIAPSVAQEYDRNLFGRWQGGCIDAREEAILRWSTSTSRDGCQLAIVTLTDPYSGDTYRGDSSEIDVDHVVPLKEAWDSGADVWDQWRRHEFANDPLNLIPTYAAINRSKGDRDPAEWLPPDHEARCAYIALWKEVKAKYGLSMDSREFWTIYLEERRCR